MRDHSILSWVIYLKYKHAPLPFPWLLESRTLWRTTVATHFIIILEIKVCNALLLSIVHVTVLKCILFHWKWCNCACVNQLAGNELDPHSTQKAFRLWRDASRYQRQRWFPHCTYEKGPCYGISASVVTRRMAWYQARSSCVEFITCSKCTQTLLCPNRASCFHASVKLQPLMWCPASGQLFFSSPILQLLNGVWNCRG